MCPGSRPATGWMPNRTVVPFSRRRRVRSATGYCACATAMPYPGVMITLEAPARISAAASALTSRGSFEPDPARDDGEERPVHPLAHDVGQVRAGRADERAGDDQQVVAEQEP